MCALRVQINKFIFEKVFLDQIPINFFQNWFYYCVPSHISKIFFFFFCLSFVQLSLLLSNNQLTVKHYTNIFSNLYNLYSLSLSYLSYQYNIRKSHKHRVIEPKSQKRKKKNKTQIQFTINNSVHHSSINTTSPQAQIVRF